MNYNEKLLCILCTDEFKIWKRERLRLYGSINCCGSQNYDLSAGTGRITGTTRTRYNAVERTSHDDRGEQHLMGTEILYITRENGNTKRVEPFKRLTICGQNGMVTVADIFVDSGVQEEYRRSNRSFVF